jgi:predicted acylesterase/phospholipase RssA
MFGGYQAGVWKELETLIPPDVVLGASIGSLNGWAIAGGASGDQLRDWWLSVGGEQKLGLRFPRRWLDGLVVSEALMIQIESLYKAFPRRADYGVVLTELPRFRPRLFVNQEVEWQHLAASCAVIGVLKMHKFGKRVYADGGILDPRPFTGVSHFAPDLIVSVNVLPTRSKGGYGAMIGGLQWVTRYAPSITVPIIEVGPDMFLGSIGDAVRFKRDNFERWFQQGREAMRRRLPELETYLR